MFVKSSWNSRAKNAKKQHHIAESYRDPETKQPRHRLVMNITDLPEDVIEAIRRSLKGDKLVSLDEVRVTLGDTYRGAGLLAIYTIWEQLELDKALSCLSPSRVQSVFLLVAKRILAPKGTLSVQKTFHDTLFARSWSASRFDEEELHTTVKELDEQFLTIYEKLQEEGKPALILCDTIAPYFEEEEPFDPSDFEDHSQEGYLVIGLRSNETGLSLKVWQEATNPRSSRKEAKCEYLLDAIEQGKREQRLTQKPSQGNVFEGDVLEKEDLRRSVDCGSPYCKGKDQRQFEETMVAVEKELEALHQSCKKRRYYSLSSLRNKVDKILDQANLQGLLDVGIVPEALSRHPCEKQLLTLRVKRAKVVPCSCTKMEDAGDSGTSSVKDQQMREIPSACYEKPQEEQGFSRGRRQDIRDFYPSLEHIRGYVLLGYMAFYITKQMERNLRAKGITEQVEAVLTHWDTLQMSESTVGVDGENITDLNWNLGPKGLAICDQISELGLWEAIQESALSLLTSAKKS